MKISIVTPTFNSEKTVLDTCKSISSQSYNNFEHIIIDNCSSDSTIDLIKEHYTSVKLEDKLKIYIERDKGISDAFNKGIRHASGDIIAILNSDDYYLYNDLFKDILEAFEKPGILLVHGDIFFEDSIFGSNTRKPLLKEIDEGAPLNHPTCFVRKNLYQTYGIFDLSYKYAMDFEWCSRFYDKEKNNLFYIDKTFTHMRGGGASDNYEKLALNEVKLALVNNNLWSIKAKHVYNVRLKRLQMKKFLNRFSLNMFIKLWRHIKWRN